MIMCEGALFLTATSTLPPRSETKPLRATQSSSKDQQTGVKLLGPSSSHENWARGREGTFFTLRGGEIQRALFLKKQPCSLAHLGLAVSQPHRTYFRTYVRDRQDTRVCLPCFKDLDQHHHHTQRQYLRYFSLSEISSDLGCKFGTAGAAMGLRII